MKYKIQGKITLIRKIISVMSVLVGEKVDDGKNGANSNGDDEIAHELMEWHPTSGLLAITTYRANVGISKLLAITTYRANVGSEINFFTHQDNIIA
ncbi:unnamed protein product [Wuchereria bancrofti]|uniref:Uncharacterized protein n=1 Tax=Wuchereria bancrofti TaxID=6293 RepID=A0A3P7DRI7_WUCBA|nr:unnamed protein product [Wuchereria bancrofti]